VQPAALQPVASPRPAPRDWSANGRPRSLSTAGAPAATGLPAAGAAPEGSKSLKSNNVFTGANGQVYRLVPAAPAAAAAPETGETPRSIPLPQPAREPEYVVPRPAPEAAPERERSSRAVQWEQRTESGWQPAARNPSFETEAPALNREAAAREVGEARASSAREASAPSFSAPAPITPTFHAAPSAPPMGGGRGR
jgi:hypothetical protein